MSTVQRSTRRPRRRPSRPVATDCGEQTNVETPEREPQMVPASRPGRAWYESTCESTWVLGLSGALMLWAAFPPLGWWPLTWLAPLPWLALIASPRFGDTPWKRAYLPLWVAGFVHWLMVLQGIRLAHWATYFGWFALSAYLAVYLPAFIALSRRAVHILRVPIWVAAPVVWVGLELLRGHLITGFSMALLGHTQVEVLSLIQISNVTGGYGVSFLIMLVAATAFASWPRKGIAWRPWPALAGAAAVGGALVYGALQLAAGPGTDSASPTLKVALIQRSVETIFEFDPNRNLQTFYDYRATTLDARAEHPDLDLIVWPESVYTANIREILFDGPPKPPPSMGMSAAEFEAAWQRWTQAFAAKNQNLADAVNSVVVENEIRRGSAAMLVGTDCEYIRDDRSHFYNTAMLLGPGGEVEGRYFKMHPVMFGEYVPFGDWIPLLYQLTPLSQGLTAGEQPECFEVAGMRLCPNICFESTVPHLVRRQVRDLDRRGKSPHALVSVTNDGWFRGSSMLDLHVMCAQFRAVENRRPFLVAANTGITAHVDSTGRIREHIAPLQDGYLVATVTGSQAWSFYTRWGDLFAGACLLLTGLTLGGSMMRQRSAHRKQGKTE